MHLTHFRLDSSEKNLNKVPSLYFTGLNGGTTVIVTVTLSLLHSGKEPDTDQGKSRERCLFQADVKSRKTEIQSVQKQ